MRLNFYIETHFLGTTGESNPLLPLRESNRCGSQHIVDKYKIPLTRYHKRNQMATVSSFYSLHR
jgi:hypothetical protein